MLPLSEKSVSHKSKTLISSRFLRERRLSAKQSNTGAGLQANDRFFILYFYIKSGTSPWRNKIAAEVPFYFPERDKGERFRGMRDDIRIKTE